MLREGDFVDVFGIGIVRVDGLGAVRVFGGRRHLGLDDRLVGRLGRGRRARGRGLERVSRRVASDFGGVGTGELVSKPFSWALVYICGAWWLLVLVWGRSPGYAGDRPRDLASLCRANESTYEWESESSEEP